MLGALARVVQQQKRQLQRCREEEVVHGALLALTTSPKCYGRERCQSGSSRISSRCCATAILLLLSKKQGAKFNIINAAGRIKPFKVLDCCCFLINAFKLCYIWGHQKLLNFHSDFLEFMKLWGEQLAQKKMIMLFLLFAFRVWIDENTQLVHLIEPILQAL